jgi:hypothetical protein
VPSDSQQESSLIDRFVSTFEILDDMTAWDTDPVALSLAVGLPDQYYGFKHWKPVRIETLERHLEPLYSKLPARFPRLFEGLVLAYRWTEVDLEFYRLLPNPPGEDLGGLFAAMSKDRFMWKCLIDAGYIRFAMGPDIDYAPVCFDISSRTKNRDYRIVKIDHEEILCNNRIKVVAELAPSFQQLVENTIQLAEAKRLH